MQTVTLGEPVRTTWYRAFGTWGDGFVQEMVTEVGLAPAALGLTADDSVCAAGVVGLRVVEVPSRYAQAGATMPTLTASTSVVMRSLRRTSTHLHGDR